MRGQKGARNKHFSDIYTIGSNQGNQDFRGNHKNVMQGQRPDKYNKENEITKIIQSNKSIWAIQTPPKTGSM